jgi:hypothetical protein
MFMRLGFMARNESALPCYLEKRENWQILWSENHTARICLQIAYELTIRHDKSCGVTQPFEI